MSQKDAKQVMEIHALLTASIRAGDNADIVLETLQKKLHCKNIAPLRFVGISLGCGFHPDPKKPKKTRMGKSDWVEELLKWVSLVPSFPIGKTANAIPINN